MDPVSCFPPPYEEAMTTEAKKINKIQHSLNGNTQSDDDINILQINTSNADCCSKIHELRSKFNANEAHMIIISEANSEVQDQAKYYKRARFFPDFQFEDKAIAPHAKARLTVMVKNDI